MYHILNIVFSYVSYEEVTSKSENKEHLPRDDIEAFFLSDINVK